MWENLFQFLSQVKFQFQFSICINFKYLRDTRLNLRISVGLGKNTYQWKYVKLCIWRLLLKSKLLVFTVVFLLHIFTISLLIIFFMEFRMFLKVANEALTGFTKEAFMNRQMMIYPKMKIRKLIKLKYTNRLSCLPNQSQRI